MKKIVACLAIVAVMFAAVGCSSGSAGGDESGEIREVYTVGLCNYVDDASLNQIVENIETRLAEIGDARGVEFEIAYDNCNADGTVLNQIVANFIVDDVDIMVGVATPVAMAMQAATEDIDIPVVFSAVSDPVGVALVETNEAPGDNITGTSDYLDTKAVIDLIVAVDPDINKVGILYDQGQDSSIGPVAEAKEYLASLGIEVIEKTGTTTDEIILAAQSLCADGVEAVFTPTDNTVMTAELSIYEILAEAGVAHYTGADSFALNGAFIGYGVDYANLGAETAEMIAEVLLDGKDPATLAVRTFDNGTATVNTETCAALGLDYEEVEAAISHLCTEVKTIVTAESFDEVE